LWLMTRAISWDCEWILALWSSIFIGFAGQEMFVVTRRIAPVSQQKCLLTTAARFSNLVIFGTNANANH
jgi:hypothetical protein